MAPTYQEQMNVTILWLLRHEPNGEQLWHPSRASASSSELNDPSINQSFEDLLLETWDLLYQEPI